MFSAISLPPRIVVYLTTDEPSAIDYRPPAEIRRAHVESIEGHTIVARYLGEELLMREWPEALRAEIARDLARQRQKP